MALFSKVAKAFLSLSYQHRDEFRAEIECIGDVLKRQNVDTMVFVNQYTFATGQERETMRAACEEIRRCDVLIAEVSHKAIGIGIEIGYAIALEKPVLYVRKSTAEYSTTVGGVATAAIVYDDVDDLARQLSELLTQP
jgi:nucleoside 2-deoxyribosyltransferase